MHPILVKCPQTGRSVETGLRTTKASFDALSIRRVLTCPDCGRDHAWSCEEAFLGEEELRGRGALKAA